MRQLKTKVIYSHSDPSHGWARVRLKDIADLGIEKLISSYSYVYSDYAYLEEDCDLTLFVTKFKEKYPKTDLVFKGTWSNNRSRIRYYEPYSIEYFNHVLKRNKTDETTLNN